MDMFGKYYAGSNAAQMAQANAALARANAVGGSYGADKQRLAELKAMQADYTNRLKDKMLGLPSRAGERAAITAKLDQINAAIAQMAGLDTMVPQAPQPSGAGGTNLPPLTSFYNK
jgi:hypothetical protein